MRTCVHVSDSLIFGGEAGRGGRGVGPKGEGGFGKKNSRSDSGSWAELGPMVPMIGPIVSMIGP